LTELKFKGILISEDVAVDTRQVVLPLMVTLFLVVAVTAKFLFGWNTAWTVGGFFVALVTLLWMRATYMASGNRRKGHLGTWTWVWQGRQVLKAHIRLYV
jgi:uncharacterized membrane protein